MILVAVGEPSYWRETFVEKENDEMLNQALDLVEETIKNFHMRVEKYLR